MTQPLVSVIVPVYNTRPYVRKAVRSVLDQTHRPIEVIAVDDGSADGSVAEIADLVSTGRVKLISQTNAGVAAARNAGVRASTGAYLVFLDSDDYLHPEMVGRLLQRMAPSDPSQYAYCDYRMVNSSGAVVPPATYAVRSIRRTLEGNLLPALLPISPIYPNCLLLDRRLVERLEGFEERFTGYDDSYFLLRASCEGAHARFVDLPLAFHLDRADSQSKDLSRQDELANAVFTEIHRRYPEQVAAALAEMWIEAQCQTNALWQDAQDHLAVCERYARSLEASIAEKQRILASALADTEGADRGTTSASAGLARRGWNRFLLTLRESRKPRL